MGLGGLGFQLPSIPTSIEEIGEMVFGGPGQIQIAPIPVGATTTVIKKGGMILPFIAGAAAGYFFGGNGGQQVTPEQPTTVTPTITAAPQQALPEISQILEQMSQLQAEAQAQAEAAAAAETVTTVTPQYILEDISGQVEIGGVSTVPQIIQMPTPIAQPTISQDIIGQIAEAIAAQSQAPIQVTVTAPEQVTTATKLDTGLIAMIIAVVGIAAAALFFFKKKK